MKAIRIHQYGGPEQLKLEDITQPSIEDNEILVRVRAAGINPVDYKMASGMRKEVYSIPLPWIPGKDFSGIIEAVGSSIKDFEKGQEIFGNASGAYAEYLKATPDTIAIKPKNLSFVEAASLPVAGLTAWQCLFDHGHLQAGQTVLIHGGAGGVGSFAVQLAHWKGAKVIATASESNFEFLRSIGADEVIDYKKTAFESVAKDVDVVIDLISGDTLARSFQVLKPGGYLISTLEEPSAIEAKKYQIHASSMRMQVSRKALEALAELLEKGKIKTFVFKTYPLEKAKEAWEQIMSGHTRGKIVLEL